MGQFHSNALHQIQKIEGGTKGAIEEAFAYVVSGEEVEKNEFLTWAETFEAQAQQFESDANLQESEEETEKTIFSKIKATQQRLVEAVIPLFQEYEKRGTISTTTFHVFEEIVDELTTNVDLLVEFELQKVSESQNKAISLIEDAELGFYTLGILSVVLALALGWYFSREISLPVDQLGKFAQQIGEGQFSQRVVLKTSNEFGTLASGINLMAGNLEKSQRELVSKNMELQLQSTHLRDKNTEMERFTYTVSHDLKSPLITIRAFLGLLEQDLAKDNAESAQKDMNRIYEATGTMQTLLEDLLNYLRLGHLVHQSREVSSKKVAEEALILV